MPIRGSRRPSVVPITAPSFPTSPQPHVYRKIAYTFVAFTVLIVIAVLWMSSVRAEITVKAKRDSVKLDGTVEVAKDPKNGQIPGRVFQGVFKEIREFEVQDANASSTELTPPTPSPLVTPPPTPAPIVPAGQTLVAKGTVRIINKYSRAQTLVKTTRLLTTDGKLYRIDRTVNVPANSELSVGIYADKEGSEFAIPPATFSIPGLWIDLQKFIYAQSDEAFVAVPSNAPAPTPKATKSTSSVTIVPKATKLQKLVTAANLEDAYKMLYDVVLDQAKQRLMAEVSDAKLSEQVIFVKNVKKTSNVLAGQSADKFMAQVEMDVTVVFYPKEDMQALIRSKLKEKIPEGREFLPIGDNAVNFTLDSSDPKKESAVIHVKADGQYRLTVTSPSLDKSVVAGKNKTDAAAVLRAVDGVESVDVVIKPSWLSKVPTLKDHIDLKVE